MILLNSLNISILRSVIIVCVIHCVANGTDIDNWTIQELSEVVLEFQQAYGAAVPMQAQEYYQGEHGSDPHQNTDYKPDANQEGGFDKLDLNGGAQEEEKS